MIKSILSRLLWGTALLSLCTGMLTACDDKKEEGEGNPPEPTVALVNGDVTSNTLKFKITITDADKCTYLCTKSSEEVPSLSYILTNGETVTASGTVTIENLEPNTTYLLSAVASKDKTYSKVVTLQNTTSAPDVHPAIALTAGTTTTSNLTFGAALTEAQTAAYVCLEKTDGMTIPTAEQILKDGTAIAESGEITVYELKASTTYVIAAAVANSGIYSDVEKIEMTTADPAPIVTVLAGTPAETSLSFSVALSGFDQAAYLCVKMEADTQTPTAEKILADGIAITKTGLITADGLEAGTIYLIAVAAKFKSVYSEVKSIEMTTEAAEGGPIRFTRQAAGGYYGVPKGSSYGEYLVVLADGESVEIDGVYTTIGAGRAMSIDLYQLAPTTTSSITLPARNYRYATTKSLTTFHPDKTYCMVNDGKGNISKVEFNAGTIDIKKVGSTFTFTIALTTTDGEEFIASYEGPAVIEDKTGGGIAPLPNLEKDLKDLSFIRALAKYYHSEETGSDECIVNIYDVEPTVNQGSDYLSTAGHMLTLDLSTAVSAEMQLQEGTYMVSTTGKPGTYTAGSQIEFMETMLAVGTYCEERNDKYESVYGFVKYGTVKIAKSGENYQIEVDLTTDKYYHITGTYEGKIEMTDKR